MPADLHNPFGESCCDGGACSENKHESAQPCGCDKGANWICAEHRRSEHVIELSPEDYAKFVEAMDNPPKPNEALKKLLQNDKFEIHHLSTESDRIGD